MLPLPSPVGFGPQCSCYFPSDLTLPASPTPRTHPQLLESDADLLLLIKTVNRVHVVDCAKVPNPDRELNRHMYSMARYGTWFMGTDPNPYGDVGDILDI